MIGYYVMLLAIRMRRAAKYWLSKFLPVKEEKALAGTGYDAEALSNSGYFNIYSGLKYAPLLLNPVSRFFFYPLVASAVLMRNSKSIPRAMGLIYEHLRWSLSSKKTAELNDGVSLRKTVDIIPSIHVSGELDKMLPLRKGR